MALTAVWLAFLGFVGVVVVVCALAMGVLLLVYGTGETRRIIRDFIRGRFRIDRRPWWDFFGFTDESDVVYPLPDDRSDARHDQER